MTAVETGESDPDAPGGGRGVQPTGPLRFQLMALDRASGQTIWVRTARQETPHEGTHPDGTWASASPVTDGEVIVAQFGSRGLYAYTVDGNLLWERDLGDMTTRRGFGEGSSPALAGDSVVVVWDHEGDSFIVALDRRTGEERWRRERDEPTSWATPVVIEVDGRQQVVTSATGRIRAYDLETGDEIWSAGGMTVNTIPTPIWDGELLYASSGFRDAAFRAIRPAGATGDLDGTDAIAWSYDQDTPYVPTPVLFDGRLYFFKVFSNVLTSLDATTGEPVYGPVRLDPIENVYASPVAAAGRIYVAGRDGTTAVIAHGPELEVVAVNTLEDGFDASPAIVGGDLYLRGRRYLYRIATEGGGEGASEEGEAEVGKAEQGKTDQGGEA